VMAQSGEQFAIANPSKGQSILDDSGIISAIEKLYTATNAQTKVLAMKRFDGVIEVNGKKLANSVTSNQNSVKRSGRNTNEL